MCMTLSGHTSTLPRLVVQGHGFEASFLRWAQVKYVAQIRRFITKAMISLSFLLVLPVMHVMALVKKQPIWRNYLTWAHLRYEASKP